MTLALLVAAGAAIGAPLRYLIGRCAQRRLGSAWPWGTFAVNISSSLALGVLLAAAGERHPELVAVFGVGFCGAMSTYSAFAFETLRLAETDRSRQALGYLLATTVAGLTAATAGWLLGAVCT